MRAEGIRAHFRVAELARVAGDREGLKRKHGGELLLFLLDAEFAAGDLELPYQVVGGL